MLLTHEYHSPDSTPALYVAPYTDNGTVLQLTGAGLTNANALHVAIVDSNGDQVISFGGGTQYTDAGVAVAHPVGTGIIFNNAGTYNFVSAAQPLPVTGSITVGGTTDNSAFTAGTTTGTPAMGFYHSTIDAVTDGRAAALAIDAKRNLFVVIRDAAGNARGLNIDGSGQLAVTGTFWQATQPISAAALPLPASAATSTKQSDGTQKTQIVDGSGNVISATSNALDINIKSGNPTTIAVTNTGTFAVQAAQATAGNLNMTEASAASSLTSLQLIDDVIYTSGDTLSKTAGIAAQFDDVAPGAVTENKMAPLRMSTNRALYVMIRDNAGNERGLNVDANGAIAVTATNATASNLKVAATLDAETTKVIGTVRALGNGGATLDSTVGAGTAPTNQVVAGALYNSTEISPTTGQAFALQADSKGRLRGVIMDAAGNTRGANVDASSRLSVTLDNIAASQTLATVTTVSTVTNLAQMNGAAITMGNGVSGTGVQRVTIASDSTGQIALAAGSATIGALTANQSINNAQIGGNTISTSVGATGNGTQRMVLANDAGKTLASKGGSVASSGDNTLVVAGTNKLKVYAFSLSTVSTTAVTCIFQSGASGTELWRVILQTPASVAGGANLVVQPPAWLFATAAATLLNMNLSAAVTVHYSVSYFDEA